IYTDSAMELALLSALSQRNCDAADLTRLNAGGHFRNNQRRGQLHICDFKRLRTVVFEAKRMLPFLSNHDLAEVDELGVKGSGLRLDSERPRQDVKHQYCNGPR